MYRQNNSGLNTMQQRGLLLILLLCLSTLAVALWKSRTHQLADTSAADKAAIEEFQRIKPIIAADSVDNFDSPNTKASRKAGSKHKSAKKKKKQKTETGKRQKIDMPARNITSEQVSPG